MGRVSKKILFIMVILMQILGLSITKSYATTEEQYLKTYKIAETIGDPINSPEDYNPKNDPMAKADYNTFLKKANIVITIMRVIGTIAAVIAILAMGIKYMAGSIEEKATYKETMIPYVIGAIMLFAIPNLLGIIANLVNSMTF